MFHYKDFALPENRRENIGNKSWKKR